MKILVAIDHSVISANALKYAINLFPTLQKEITVFHVFSSVFEPEFATFSKLGHTTTEEILDSIEQFIVDNLDRTGMPHISLHYACIEGNPVQEITKKAFSGDYDLIVMGTRDKYPFVDRWMGTISLGVAKTSKVPVLMIPPKIVHNKFNTILVASDKHLLKTEILHFIREWSTIDKSSVEFLHIQKSGQQHLTEESKHIVDELFQKDKPSFAFEILEQQSEDISQALIQTSKEKNADLIMLMPDHQNYLSSLFFKSISKDMILGSSIPLLFIPEEVDRIRKN